MVDDALLLAHGGDQGEAAVIGLGRSGRAAATVLAARGRAVYASDAGSGEALEKVAKELRKAGVAVDLGGHDLARIARAALAVASPGIPPTAPPIRAALDAGVAVVGEVEIALRMLQRLRYIAVTGSNGKTTTTTLIGRMLQAVGRRAATVGNIGTPIVELALQHRPPEWAALELSSFQLHDTPSIAPTVGVLTNLSPNHLDRYESVGAYYADKRLLFQNAAHDSKWVVNRDDSDVCEMIAGVPGEQRWFSLRAPADAYYDSRRRRLIVLGDPLLTREELPLLGDHNVANALAAALAVMVADPAHRTPQARAKIAEVLRTAKPLPHRIEPVGDAGGLTWIDDSKSTSVAATLVALQGMTRRAVVLLGGRHKGEPYTALIPELKRVARAVVAYGEAGELIERDLGDAVPVTRVVGTFDDVVAHGRSLARSGDVLLLSPACSSYDMFANYEERGAAFARLARASAGAASHA